MLGQPILKLHKYEYCVMGDNYQLRRERERDRERETETERNFFSNIVQIILCITLYYVTIYLIFGWRSCRTGYEYNTSPLVDSVPWHIELDRPSASRSNRQEWRHSAGICSSPDSRCRLYSDISPRIYRSRPSRGCCPYTRICCRDDVGRRHNPARK